MLQVRLQTVDKIKLQMIIYPVFTSFQEAHKNI